MERKIIPFLKSIFPVILAGVLMAVGTRYAMAQGVLGDSALKYLEGQGLQGSGIEGSGEDLAAQAVRRVVRLVKFLAGAVAVIFGLLYAVQFIFARGNEESISHARTNFLYILLGFIVLMVSDGVAQIFNPEQASSDQLIDFNAAHDRLREVVDYAKWLLGSIMGLLLTLSGVRLMTAGGNQEEIDTEKRHLVWSGIGMLVVLLASNLVNAIYVVNESTGAAQAADASAGITEFGGLIRLVLVFLGPVAVLFTIYAGFLYLTSLGNEENVNKAKKMLVAGITGIVIIYSAYAIVNNILGGGDSLNEAVSMLL